MNVASYKDAKNLFLSGDYSVEDYFEKNNLLLEYAYCKLLSGDLDSAEEELKKIQDKDFRADWGVKLIQFIRGHIITAPSYFQIRNFLEIDLNLLLKAGQAEFVENIINGADVFYSINPESYKFISRVMMNNDFYDVAMYYLLRAKEKFYQDPEMHFMLANCYLKSGEKKLAIDSLNNCLNILPEYYPARKILETITGNN